MELELEELFPKKSDLRLQAVRLLMHLEESGAKRQTELAEELGMEDYAMSRLLARLELHRYIARRREGTDKIVILREERQDSASGDVLLLGARSLSIYWQRPWHRGGAPFQVFQPRKGGFRAHLTISARIGRNPDLQCPGGWAS